MVRRMPPFLSVSLWLREKPLLRIEHGLITPSMYNLRFLCDLLFNVFWLRRCRAGFNP